jgi:hypothetical protein
LVSEQTAAHRYARIERERHFLDRTPSASEVRIARRITDRYLTGTRLRLRRSERLDDGTSEFKFTQKIPVDSPGPRQGWITNTYWAGSGGGSAATSKR